MSEDICRRPFASLSLLLVAACVPVLAVSLSMSELYFPILALLAVAVVLSENFALDVPGVGSTSISYPLSVAAIILMGPAAGGLVSVFASVNRKDWNSRRPFPVVAFNAAQLVLSSSVAGLAYMGLGGRLLVHVGPLGASMNPLLATDLLRSLPALAACAVTSFLLNDVFVSLALSLLHGTSPAQVWRDGLLWMIPTQIAMAVVGFTVAQVLAVTPESFLLLVFPLVVARQVYQNYLTLKSAYIDTIRSIVNVLEAKDPYTRGHSVRVAGYSLDLARFMGLSPADQAQVETSAVLHDIGKLGLPRSLLVKAGPLTGEELDSIRAHPRLGAEMIAGIPFLKGLSQLIECHHVHYGGGGYGSELKGDDLPLPSRILAVADSYDAMTSARPYRPAMSHQAAIAELLEGAGTQFDPEVVRAFIDGGIGAADLIQRELGFHSPPTRLAIEAEAT